MLPAADAASIATDGIAKRPLDMFTIGIVLQLQFTADRPTERPRPTRYLALSGSLDLHIRISLGAKVCVRPFAKDHFGIVKLSVVSPYIDAN